MDGSLPHGRLGRGDAEGGAVLKPAGERASFILANTALLVPPHVPEIRLHLADEAHDLWLKTEEELQEIGLPPPFWAFAWAGGQGLARHVLDNPGLVAGKRVLDLATGSGLVAIAAALAGAAEVVANDIEPFCEAAVALNARANGVTITFDGRDLTTMPPPECFDVILAGDVFYDAAMTACLTAWFEATVERGVRVVVGDPGRHYLPKERLTRLAEYQVPVTRELEDTEVKRTVVWEFKAP